MANPKIIANQAQLNEELEKLGGDNHYCQPQLVVNTTAHIDANNIKSLSGKDKRLYLKNCVFNDMVFISNFTDEQTVYLNQSHFLRGLWVEGCDLKILGISESQLKSLVIHRVKTKMIGFGDLKIEGNFEIDGLTFDSEKPLNLIGVEYGSLATYSPQTGDTVKVPAVVTDDPVTAIQFQLLGVPVDMSTEVIRRNQEILMKSATA